MSDHEQQEQTNVRLVEGRERCPMCKRIGLTEKHLRELRDAVAGLAEEEATRSRRARSSSTFSLALGRSSAYEAVATIIDGLLDGATFRH